MSSPTFYEFFAGGGMARAGLGEKWECTFANDMCEMKARVYRENWSIEGADDHLVVQDVTRLSSLHLPGRADLAWASFPCQDLSLAGKGKGIGRSVDSPETRSGAYWGFWSLIDDLRKEGRKPRAMVLENVSGFLSANGAKDFRLVCESIAALGYRFGALTIDAKHFVPQSRPRVFIVAIDDRENIEQDLYSSTSNELWHPRSLLAAYETLPPKVQSNWIWWSLPAPPKRNTELSDFVEAEPVGVKWNSPTETRRLVSMMSDTNLAKLAAAKSAGSRRVGTVYKRTRIEKGKRIQRAEIRFDGIAGCLRTPGGGSSRQTIVVVEDNEVKSRLLSPNEAAALMGLTDYVLPPRYNDAYHVAGDGVCVPVVSFISQNLVEPALGLVPCKEFPVAA